MTDEPTPLIAEIAELQKLQDCWRVLKPQDRATLLAFAEFLQARAAVQGLASQSTTLESLPPLSPLPVVTATAPASVAPLNRIPRPETESVIAAVKRLSASYPMLNKTAMLNETSELVAQHIMNKREATVVIDELEIIFARAYQQWLTAQSAS